MYNYFNDEHENYTFKAKFLTTVFLIYLKISLR